METWIDYIAFVLLVFGTSVISGIVGMLGGMVLLAAMGTWFPPEVLIPLHGCIQLVSNGSRVVMLRRAVVWPQLGWFAPGAIAASLLALVWLPSLPQDVMSVVIAIVCIVLVWFPVFFTGRAPAIAPARFGLTGLGAGITFLSLIAGAIGPLLDAFVVHSGLEKQQLLGTKAGFQVISHSLKIIVFGIAGFAIATWLPIIGLTIPVTILGNRLGQAVMRRIPQAPFMLVLRVLVTLLSIVMIL